MVVNVKKDTKGIGIGLVDGENTAFGVAGVYVRFLIPESDSSKVSRFSICTELRSQLFDISFVSKFS